MPPAETIGWATHPDSAARGNGLKRDYMGELFSRLCIRAETADCRGVAHKVVSAWRVYAVRLSSSHNDNFCAKIQPLEKLLDRRPCKQIHHGKRARLGSFLQCGISCRRVYYSILNQYLRLISLPEPKFKFSLIPWGFGVLGFWVNNIDQIACMYPFKFFIEGFCVDICTHVN